MIHNCLTQDFYVLTVISINFLFIFIPLNRNFVKKNKLIKPVKSYRNFIFDTFMLSLVALEIAVFGGFIFFISVRNTQPGLIKKILFLNALIQPFFILVYYWGLVFIGKKIHSFFFYKNKKIKLKTAFRRLQIFPYICAAFITLLSFLAITIYYLAGYYFLAINISSLLSLMFIIMISIIGGNLFIIPFLRNLILPHLKQIACSGIFEHSKVRSPLSLRFKLGIWFGAVVFIATAFSAFWSYSQYENLVENFLNKRAETRINSMKNDLKNKLVLVSKVDSGPTINSLLKNYAQGDSGYYFHLPTSGKAWFTSQKNRLLDVVNRYKIRNFSRGTLKIPPKNLYGYFVEIKYDNNRIGAIGVLYRDQSSSRLDRPGKIFRIILFYFFLFLMAAGGVAYYVSEFTSPLRKLENRVSAITAGKFNQKIEPQGEVDEIGRLSFTLELMRKTIREKVTTIENLNINLENMVKERTIDLAKANKELKKTLAELKNAQKQLIATEKLAAFGRLLAGLAHEINNPVNSIANTLNPLDNLIDKITKTDPEPQDIKDIKSMINILNRGTNRIRQVIDRITNTLKSDNSPRKKIQVKESIENAISLISGKLEDIKIIKELQKDAYISASPGAIEEVFENLIINAADAMEKSSEKILKIKVKVEEDKVRIEFEDKGSGIPYKIREKIFDPFFTTKEVGGGMGLGLSIVNDIVKSYNGDLEIVSLRKGTRVVLVFPKPST